MSSEWLSEHEYQAVGQHLNELVQEFEALPFPQVKEKVFDLLQTIDLLHREGLNRLVVLLQQHGQTQALDQAAQDPIVHTLFSLYDLVPADDLTQVNLALEAVRPYIHSHGGQVEVLQVVDGVVHLRLGGACQGCAGSAITLKRGIETALREGYPGFKGIQTHDPVPTRPAIATAVAGFITLDKLDALPHRRARRPIFKQVARLAELPDGGMRAFDVDGVAVLVANINGEVYAVRDRVPNSMAPLSLGSFSPPIVVGPWTNDAFDIRTGKRADGMAGPGLDVIPVAVADDTIRVAVNIVTDTVGAAPT